MKNILKKITPSEKEVKKLKSQVDNIMKKLNSKLKKINAEAILGGSAAKNTWLKGQHDIDIFVKFNYKKYSNKSSQISDILGKNLPFPYKRLKGSRDYFQIKKNNFTFEIVPILNIKKAEEALNITDISPLHVDYINKHSKNLKNEIRLAKSYANAINVYGAESYINGFSGYVLEVLIIHYGSFKNLIKNAAKWKLKQVIDPEKYYKNEDEVFKTLSTSKTYSPLILIDPVQKDRNAAAALSIEKFTEFITECKTFSLKQFEEKKFNLNLFKKEATKTNTTLLTLSIKPKDKIDIFGAKLIKVLNKIKYNLEINDFRIYKCNFYWNKKDRALLYFLVFKENLPKYKKHFGPPVWEHEHCEKFIQKYKDKEIKTENNRLYVELERKYIKPEQYFKHLIKEKF